MLNGRESSRDYRNSDKEAVKIDTEHITTEQATTEQTTRQASADIPQEVQLIVNALDDKRAQDIVVMDLSTASETLDYFIVASGESGLQLKAMEDGVKETLKEAGTMPKAIEGPSGRLVLMDYGYITVHIMSPDAREFYDLEGLWADAERLEIAPV